MSDPTCLPFAFPSIQGKKLTAAFDGGRLTLDGGVMLLVQAARRLGLAEKLAAVIPNRRDLSRVVHPLPEILLARILAIACGYEDADDGDHHPRRRPLRAARAMDWSEDNAIAYVFGLTGTKALAAKVEPTADHIRVVRALSDK